MESEIEIPETPNWLKELEAKRERRLKTKLGHELGAGAPCLSCEEKCPGLDLHFWRKICKNCKCSKENHEVQDDDIYGWAQHELLGTKVNKLKKKIVLPGRKEEIELEWAPDGARETVDKYLKSLPTESLPVKGSQAAQDRKQLLKKQIPIHDIDPTLCHELSEEELEKMKEYVVHMKQNSVGVGHLIQINTNSGLTHILDENETMFLINNVPKSLINSENVVLQESNNAVSLKHLTNALSKLNMKNKQRLAVQEPNMIIPVEIDDQSHFFTDIGNKPCNINDSLSRSNTNNIIYSPTKFRIPTEDIQDPKQVTLRNLSYAEKSYDNMQMPLIPVEDEKKKTCDNEKIYNMQFSSPNIYRNSNVKNLVPSAFVPLKHLKDKHTLGEVPGANNSDSSITKDLAYPSQFINEHMKSRENICNYKPEIFNTSNECQNSSYFQPITDSNYPFVENKDLPQYSLVVPMKDNKKETNTFSDKQNSGSKFPYQSDEYSSGNDLGSSPGLTHKSEDQGFSNFAYNAGDGMPKRKHNEAQQLTGRIEQSPQLSLSKVGQNYLDEDPQQSFKFKGIKDLAYSTFDSSPMKTPDGHHNPIVEDHLNNIKKELPVFEPSNSHVSDINLSPHLFFIREQRENANKTETGELSSDINEGYDKSQIHEMCPKNRNFQTLLQDSLPRSVHPQSYSSQCIKSDNMITESPSWNKGIHSSNICGGSHMSLPRRFLEKDSLDKELLPEGKLGSTSPNSNLSVYSPGNKNVHEQCLQPTIIPIGSIKDVEYTDPEIRVALSKDNDLFEGSMPNKFIPNHCISKLPSCHYCKEQFKQDELAIAIPERSEAIFHTDCFKCQGCNQILADMFYFYDKDTDNIYCGRDYAKIRGIPRCRACDELIFVKEYCLAENSTFHVKHFCCFECDKPLAGQNYVMENDQPLCVPCYEITKANKCYACKDVIHPDQQGLQLKDGVHFHATENCFACKICKKPLFGAKLLFRNDYLYCSHDCYSLDV